MRLDPRDKPSEIKKAEGHSLLAFSGDSAKHGPASCPGAPRPTCGADPHPGFPGAGPGVGFGSLVKL